ncbi:MAG: hypothetical protein K9G49_12480 [Taibaiella sp.]|nr:hypothetical protein [Taibaiella sp.]
MKSKKTGFFYRTKDRLQVLFTGAVSVVAIATFIMCFFVWPSSVIAQVEATAAARVDARQIVVGDQVRLFLEVKNYPASGRLEWAAIPDTFNSLEIVERGKIDTQNSGGHVIYKQRLILTGFDSGLFKVPSFIFPVITTTGTTYTVQTDSFLLAVQTVAVDTTKAFRPIKGIMFVDWSWLDYLWYIIGAIVLIALIVVGVIYYLRRPKPAPVVPEGPKESLQEHTLRLLAELDAKGLWQKKQVKEYYVELTDVVRNYIEARFHTPALELTTDELLYKVQMHRELQPYHSLLTTILTTADLAKFAKAQPLPHEHTDAMDKARQLVLNSKPVITVPPTEQTI